MRILMGLGMLGMAFLAIFYLRRRRMPFEQFLAWGLVAIFIPVFGPFWVIYMRPGRPAWSRQRRANGRLKSMARPHKRTPLHWLKKLVM
jgi:hypothetical protein